MCRGAPRAVLVLSRAPCGCRVNGGRFVPVAGKGNVASVINALLPVGDAKRSYCLRSLRRVCRVGSDLGRLRLVFAYRASAIFGSISRSRGKLL